MTTLNQAQLEAALEAAKAGKKVEVLAGEFRINDVKQVKSNPKFKHFLQLFKAMFKKGVRGTTTAYVDDIKLTSNVNINLTSAKFDLDVRFDEESEIKSDSYLTLNGKINYDDIEKLETYIDMIKNKVKEIEATFSYEDKK